MKRLLITSKRELSDGIYYYVNPTKFEKHDDYTLLKLENHVNDNYQKYNYNLNIYIWNLDLILRICQINNLVLIKNSYIKWSPLKHSLYPKSYRTIVFNLMCIIHRFNELNKYSEKS